MYGEVKERHNSLGRYRTVTRRKGSHRSQSAMDKEVLQVLLKKSTKDYSPLEIIEREVESAIQNGENYTSAVMRLKLKVVLGNGRVVVRHFIMKQVNTGEALDQIETDWSLFGSEASMYLSVLKEMGFLMDEFGDYEDPLWCKFIHYEPVSRSILLEDLKAKGFRMVNRQTLMDLDHSMLVLRSLGRYHGMAKVLEQRGIICKRSYRTMPFLADRNYRQCMLYAGMKSLGTAIKQHWGPEWRNVANKLLMPIDVFNEKLEHSLTAREGDFTCLNHGDCWTNNIMFKYDWQDRPISLRFLDFQLPSYNSPCADLSYFMGTGIHPTVRRQNYAGLMQCYHNSLVGTLERFGYNGTVPTFEEITGMMELLSFYGYATQILLFPAFTSDSKAAIDLDKLFQTKGEFGMNDEIYKSHELVENIGTDLKEFVDKHLS